MRKMLLAASMLILVAPAALGQGAARAAAPRGQNDEEALKQLVRQWADAVVHADLANLDKIHADDFKGSSEGMNFDKKMLRMALKEGLMKVAAWNVEDMKVNIRGNSAVVTGRSTLSNAVYMGKDYSGAYEFTSRFVKQKDGTWRAVTSHSRRVKK